MAVLFTALEKSSENIHSKQQEFMVQSKEDIIKKLKQQQNKTLLSYSPQAAVTECHRLGALTQQIYFRGLEAGKSKVKAPPRSVSEGSQGPGS